MTSIYQEQRLLQKLPNGIFALITDFLDLESIFNNLAILSKDLQEKVQFNKQIICKHKLQQIIKLEFNLTKNSENYKTNRVVDFTIAQQYFSDFILNHENSDKIEIDFHKFLQVYLNHFKQPSQDLSIMGFQTNVGVYDITPYIQFMKVSDYYIINTFNKSTKCYCSGPLIESQPTLLQGCLVKQIENQDQEEEKVDEVKEMYEQDPLMFQDISPEQLQRQINEFKIAIPQLEGEIKKGHKLYRQLFKIEDKSKFDDAREFHLRHAIPYIMGLKAQSERDLSTLEHIYNRNQDKNEQMERYLKEKQMQEQNQLKNQTQLSKFEQRKTFNYERFQEHKLTDKEKDPIQSIEQEYQINTIVSQNEVALLKGINVSVYDKVQGFSMPIKTFAIYSSMDQIDFSDPIFIQNRCFGNRDSFLKNLQQNQDDLKIAKTNISELQKLSREFKQKNTESEYVIFQNTSEMNNGIEKNKINFVGWVNLDEGIVKEVQKIDFNIYSMFPGRYFVIQPLQIYEVEVDREDEKKNVDIGYITFTGIKLPYIY